MSAIVFDRIGKQVRVARRMAAIAVVCATILCPALVNGAGSSETSHSRDSAPAAKADAQFNQGDWPFRPLDRPAVPKLQRLSSWAKNPVDNFIGSKLEAAKLTPNVPADKLALLRRVTFDVTGMPPTPAEQAAFLADNSPDAYAKIVDRLLASREYGEHWAQHWLDLVRYSESEGFKKDNIRKDAYRYRDYVIRAFNDDLPYDQFVRDQIAGDELEPKNKDAQIATGFLRLYPEDINASNLVQQRQEILDDLTENTGLAFLGLTVGCAKCHDHKFDPITQVDYYRLQACFAAILPNDETSIATPGESQSYRKKMANWEDATKSLRDKLDTELADERQKARENAISAYDPQTLEAINTPPTKRTCLQEQLAAEAEEWIETRVAKAYRLCEPEERKLVDQQTKQLAGFDSIKPPPLPTAMTAMDGDEIAPKTCVLRAGNYLKPEEEVQPGFPEFLGASEPEIHRPANLPESTGRRSALAKWLTRPDHPLTARVLVNRLWQFHFGQGIVATTSDFGAMGGDPSHQELIDWLAAELVENGWHIKPIQRLMLLSAAYCQSTDSAADGSDHKGAIAADVADRLLWHSRRQRLEGDELRDAMLLIAGQLNPTMYGQSARPALPQVLADTYYGWDADQKISSRNRRSIYVLAQRNMRLPILEAFDQPDRLNSCSRRTCTTTAPQALEMLNSELTEDLAQRWSGKLIKESGSDETKLVRQAYSEAYCRTPTDAEVQAAEQFIGRQTAAIAAENSGGDKYSPIPLPTSVDRAKGAAIVDFCHAIFCSNEFLYVD
ncbi:MAG TPA: DUF1549 and DUF1553 domain-containing protein [Lacipirellulaceae bacterium]|nr:DUF1549 and DUF1553 domain-containing protein [Lacipirellulaceae bacterium]